MNRRIICSHTTVTYTKQTSSDRGSRLVYSSVEHPNIEFKHMKLFSAVAA